MKLDFKTHDKDSRAIQKASEKQKELEILRKKVQFKDLQKTIESEIESCSPREKGLPCSQLKMAIMYFNGIKVQRDETEAARLFREAAEAGNWSARRWLGAMYIAGTGVPQNVNKAYVWLMCTGYRMDEDPMYTNLLKFITPRGFVAGQRIADGGCNNFTDRDIDALLKHE